MTSNESNSNFRFSGNPKFKNVKLISPTDTGYQRYRLDQIGSQQSKRTADYIPQPKTAICSASRIVEYIVRIWHGSSSNRIIQYDVLYQGSYQRHYRECDIIQVEDDGSVTIAEIKSSYKSKANKALPQLQKSCEILSTIYTKVNPVAITIDLSSMRSIQDNFQSKSSNNISDFGFPYTRISFTLGGVLKYGITTNLNIDVDILNLAYQEALLCVQHRAEKFKIKFLQRSQESINPRCFKPIGLS